MEQAGDFFVDRIADAVAERLNRYPKTKRIYNLEESAIYLGMSEDAVKDLVDRQQLKATRLNRRLQFDIGDLDRTIEQAKVA